MIVSKVSIVLKFKQNRNGAAVSVILPVMEETRWGGGSVEANVKLCHPTNLI